MKECRFDIIRPEYYAEIGLFRKEMLEEGSSFDGSQCLDSYEDIEKWHLNCLLFERKETCPPGYVLGYQYLYFMDDDLVGMVNMRTNIEENMFLSLYGGHIGYCVRPSFRKRHIGTAMLRDFLEICRKEYGLDRVMVTCLESNIASAKIIENCGGVYERSLFYRPENQDIRRYWIEI